jgi:heme/copper-type cytochrome/quinol oxidase subunit 2
MNVTEYDKYEILVEATDLAGNTASTYDEENEAYFTFTLAEKISPLMLIIIIIVILLLLALLIYFVIRNRKKEK